MLSRLSTAFALATALTGVSLAAPSMQIEAQSVKADVSNQTTYYSGGAEAQVGNWTIKADQIDVNSAKGELTARGNVAITDSQTGATRHTDHVTLHNSDWET